ncbi:MAG: hypothetical protein WA906_03000 [Pacificimonas sp.]
MPPALRCEGRNYEEDCDHARILIAFADEFAGAEGPPFASKLSVAKDNLKRHDPGAYERHFRVELTAAESPAIARREKTAANVGEWEIMSAFGSWAWWVSEGQVGFVCRRIISERGDHGTQERWFTAGAHDFDEMKTGAAPHLLDERFAEELVEAPLHPSGLPANCKQPDPPRYIFNTASFRDGFERGERFARNIHCGTSNFQAVRRVMRKCRTGPSTWSDKARLEFRAIGMGIAQGLADERAPMRAFQL